MSQLDTGTEKKYKFHADPDVTDKLKLYYHFSCLYLVYIRLIYCLDNSVSLYISFGQPLQVRPNLYITMWDMSTVPSSMLATSFPGYSLFSRKNSGDSWSRGSQILGAKLKLYLGRGDRRVSLFYLENYNLCVIVSVAWSLFLRQATKIVAWRKNHYVREQAIVSGDKI